MRANEYRRDVDGLRGIAVLAVILGHFWPGLVTSGYLGVDVFFVISGYVITASIQKHQTEKLGSFLSHFFARRIRRLLPALLFCIVCIALISLLVVPNATVSLVTGFAAVVGMSNIYLMYNAADYFGESVAFNLFTHTWSLGVEEQFYLIYPTLFWLAAFFISRRTYKKYILLSAAISSWLCFVYLSQKHPVASYYFPFSRAWEFLIGVGVFFIRGKLSNENSSWLLTAIFVALTGLFFAPVGAMTNTTLVVALTATLIFLSVPGTSVFRWLTSTPVMWLGLRSYSLYLWHWPLLVLVKLTVGASLYWLLSALIMTLLVSEFSYRYVEIRFRYRTARPLVTYRAGLLSALSVMGILFLSAKPLSGQFLLVDNFTGNQPVHSKLSCHYGDIHRCLSKSEPTTKTAFVMGDSHATNLVPSIEKAAQENGYAVKYYGGIKSIRAIFNDPNCMDYSCVSKDVNTIEHSLADLQTDDVVFFSMSRSRLYLPDHYLYSGHSRAGLENQAGLQLLKAFLAHLADYTASKGAELVLVDDIPVTCKLADFKRLNFDHNACHLDYAESISDRRPLTELYQELSSQRQSVDYIDPHNVLCSESSCSMLRNKVPLYSDTSPHITLEHEFVFKDFFDDVIKKLNIRQGISSRNDNQFSGA